MARNVSIQIDFDLDRIGRYTDEYLAQLWHVCQANPADFGDPGAVDAAEALRHEIVRRWLRAAPVDLYGFQGGDIAKKERSDRAKKDLERWAMAEALVKSAWDETEEIKNGEWSGCTDMLSEGEAVDKAYEALGRPGLSVVVTMGAPRQYRVWTRPVEEPGGAS